MQDINQTTSKIYCMDCLEGMKMMDTNSVDLILTDPPYGINVAKRGTVGGGNRFFSSKEPRRKAVQCKVYRIPEWDKAIPPKEYFDEMFRISKNQIIFGGNYMTEHLPPSSCWIVWDKDNTGDFADCELAWASFKTAVRKFKWRWNGMLQEKMNWKEERFHPTQKPVPLFRWILEKYSKRGQVICDPFLGSGTTAVACKQLQRNFIGFEKDIEYCNIAEERVKKVPQRLDTFNSGD